MDIRDLKKEIWKAYNERSVWTQKSDVDKFKKLLDELDEPKKVYIPQFVAHWIEEAKEHYGSEIDPLKIVYWTGDYISDTDPHYEWLENIYNQKLLLNAVINGYEVEEPRRVVKLKGIHGLRKYVRLDDEGKVILGLAGSDGITGGALTEEEAKEKWPEFEIYYNAGLLEFEEVEDE
ncbi:DUF1642 domain-containing protein [Pediococcus acidilactici]|uniref:DUF1642 domain-containing protein n=1 Tax=Pediococcus acidilactici TaxID=1254 RepID=UPI00232C3B58|nr:DUF1642 domain-containing protein [Pediococcus acidilactici]MDB8867534.1 DUF1642 domain-containing protein [Pediococcus acidilactici]